MADTEQSKRIVLQRIQQLDATYMAQMHCAAAGVVKAVQYDIDRNPVMVFDSLVTVYSLIDLKVALHHYRAWRTRHQL